MTINDMPEVMAALHRRQNVRWKEAGRVLPERDLHRLDGITPAVMLPGVIRARRLGFDGLVPACRFDADDRALVGVRLSAREQHNARPLDGLMMTLLASDGVDQTLEGLRELQANAAPGDTLASAIEDRDGVVVADIAALGTLMTHTFGESLSLEVANAQPAGAPQPDPAGATPDEPTRERPANKPSLGL